MYFARVVRVIFLVFRWMRGQRDLLEVTVVHSIFMWQFPSPGLVNEPSAACFLFRGCAPAMRSRTRTYVSWHTQWHTHLVEKVPRSRWMHLCDSIALENTQITVLSNPAHLINASSRISHLEWSPLSFCRDKNAPLSPGLYLHNDDSSTIIRSSCRAWSSFLPRTRLRTFLVGTSSRIHVLQRHTRKNSIWILLAVLFT